jgi:hypothetical protein
MRGMCGDNTRGDAHKNTHTRGDGHKNNHGDTHKNIHTRDAHPTSSGRSLDIDEDHPDNQPGKRRQLLL